MSASIILGYNCLLFLDFIALYPFQISYKAMHSKNPAKHLRKISAFRLIANSAPGSAPTNPKIIKAGSPFVWIFPLFLCSLTANKAVGIKYIKFICCAFCWLTPQNIVNAGIKIAPPPMPMPLNIPAANPITISQIMKTTSLSLRRQGIHQTEYSTMRPLIC